MVVWQNRISQAISSVLSIEAIVINARNAQIVKRFVTVAVVVMRQGRLDSLGPRLGRWVRQ